MRLPRAISLVLLVALASLSCAAKAEDAIRFGLSATRLPMAAASPRAASLSAQGCFVADGAITIDGDLSDWPRGAQPLNTSGTAAPEDLSASARIAASPTTFYFACDVTDDVHYQREYGDKMWVGDSIQFAIDPLFQRTSGGYGDYDHELGMCFVESAPLVWRWQRPSGMLGEIMQGTKIAVKTLKGRTVYEVAIALEQLWPLRPELGMPFGFSYLVNDSDGSREREGVVTWSSGIGSGKDPSAFGAVSFGGSRKGSVGAVAGRFMLPLDPTPSDKPQEWALDVHAWRAGKLTVECDGIVEHGARKGSRVTAQSTFDVPAGVSKWRLDADLSALAPARLKLKPTVTLSGARDPVPPHEFTVYVYRRAE